MSKLHSTDCCKDANSCGKKEIIIKQVKIDWCSSVFGSETVSKITSDIRTLSVTEYVLKVQAGGVVLSLFLSGGCSSVSKKNL